MDPKGAARRQQKAGRICRKNEILFPYRPVHRSVIARYGRRGLETPRASVLTDGAGGLLKKGNSFSSCSGGGEHPGRGSFEGLLGRPRGPKTKLAIFTFWENQRKNPVLAFEKIW